MSCSQGKWFCGLSIGFQKNYRPPNHSKWWIFIDNSNLMYLITEHGIYTAFLQIQSRPRNAQVIGQIAQSPSGLWASLTRNTVSQLTDPKPCSPNTLAFAEALLILLSALGQVTPGATVLNGLGLLPALLPIISNSDHDYPRVVRLWFLTHFPARVSIWPNFIICVLFCKTYCREDL